MVTQQPRRPIIGYWFREISTTYIAGYCCTNNEPTLASSIESTRLYPKLQARFDGLIACNKHTFTIKVSSFNPVVLKSHLQHSETSSVTQEPVASNIIVLHPLFWKRTSRIETRETMAGIFRKLLFCCFKPKSNGIENEDIPLSSIPREPAAALNANRVDEEDTPANSATQPRGTQSTPTAAHSSTPFNSEDKERPTNGSIHPALRTDSLTTSSKPESDPDEISTLANSAPMYRNVKHAMNDRRALMRRLRNPDKLPVDLAMSTAKGKQPVRNSRQESENQM